MINSKLLSMRPLKALPVKLVVLLAIVALLGFADAAYLTVEHYQGVIPPCTVVSGCETVLSSPYSAIAGVPVSLLGAIYYLLILIGVFTYIESKKTMLLKWALMLTIPGMIFTLWFLYVQAFILGAYCLYCLGSALATAILFFAAIFIFKKYSDAHTFPHSN